MADCPQTLNLCLTAETKCKATLDSKNKEIGLCQLGLTQSRDQSAGLNQELADTRAKLEVWYRNPFFVAGLTALAAIAVGVLRK